MTNDSTCRVIEKEAVVIGAGISGLVTAKCLKDDGYDVMVLEKSTDIGGLWKFREHDYGVMSFTHINVSKYNYCFSDYPIPDHVPDYPHHSQLYQYIHDYAQNFGVLDLIRFKTNVMSIERIAGDKWKLTITDMEDDGKTVISDTKTTIVCSYLAVASGHHAKPVYPTFKGENTFPGEIIHSVDFNDAVLNNFVGKRVLVVGIGNSAVDVAVNCVAAGRCPKVHVSTRSGTWVFSNYTMGYPTDLYISRALFAMPLWVRNIVLEAVVKMTQGSPKKWGLNPKMRIFGAQPTVSPTLVHHIQRGNINIVPNIAKIEGSTVHFTNGSSSDFDKIVYCTGYKINLPFLQEEMLNAVSCQKSNEIKLYKQTFAPSIGPSLAFIGFVQPASGGLICVSEIQARWFSALCKGQVKLPGKMEMETDIKNELAGDRSRWYKSSRHTLQRDPIVYTDQIAAMIGAKPNPISHPKLAWRLILGSGGSYQWRLEGPHKWTGAATAVKKVPVPEFSKCLGYMSLVLLVFVSYAIYRMFTYCFGC